MARSLDQVLSDLSPYYKTSEDLINSKVASLPSETEADISAADARLVQANDNIITAARRRGTGIALGGLPVAEQARYAATEYAPAILAARTKGQDRALSLQESLNQLTRDKLGQAQSIYDNELARDFQERQFQESIRQYNATAAQNAYQFNQANNRPSLDDYEGEATFKNVGKDYKFFDGSGRPITAAQYATLTGYGFRKLLSEMAAKGDSNAAIALKYTGDNAVAGAAPASIKGALSALGITVGRYDTPAPTPAKPIVNAIKTTSVLPNKLVTLGPAIGR